VSGAGEWETVIGLEVHVELSTRTKLFCSCPNEFGSEANTNVCAVCLGLPGSLPVLNEKVVDYAMRLGRALGCEVRRSIFARKNYFYPDMPKDYQVSQYDQPINVDGELDLPDGRTIGIERAHIEEDTGKSTHVGGSGRIHDASYSLVDYNRAGVPLVEVVSRPDMRSADEARAYVSELRAILAAIDVSDAKMEEGSLRVDANVSVRTAGSDVLGTRCEIKNVNSLRSLGRAIDYEVARQIDLIGAGDRVHQETRHWDEAQGRTRSGRSKEEAEDYRYFQEPDLVPVEPTADQVSAIDRAMPPLPAARRATLREILPSSEPTTLALLVERGLDDLARAAVDAGAPAGLLAKRLEHDLAVDGADTLDPVALAELIGMEDSSALTATQAKQVLAEMVASGRSPAVIAADLGFESMDTAELEGVLDGIIRANPDEWDGYVGGDDKRRGKLTGFFVGQVMKATKGQADGQAVTRLLESRRTS
jgi:aspartyl-tRNA(Asn)/glutamyl-tRNA(Gln) amidotransferase subunit B